MRATAAALVALAGCGKLVGLDSPIDGDPTGVCYGTGLVRVCFTEPPQGDPMLMSGTVNSDSPLVCSDKVVSGGTGAGGTAYCVIGAHTITVPMMQTVTSSGGKPIVFVATDSITIDGTLDFAGHRQTPATPAGGDWSGCNAASAASMAGGGAGGSFAGTGGNGGSAGGTPAMAGAALAAPTELHGGCAGQNGSGGDGAGSRGHGGGGVYLIAVTNISVTGAINASGAGSGSGGDSEVGGGGGGGSGGMIGLDAPMLALSGPVFANGGGGSSGSSASQHGSSGSDPVNGAQGGGGAGASGAGGGGGFAATANGIPGGDGVSGTTGGGGGGGSVGVILIYGTHTGAGTISPPPT